MRKVVRNKECVAFRGDTQKCVELLDSLGYKYTKCRNCLPKETKEKSLIITFYGGSYSIVNFLPPESDLEEIFKGRIIPLTFNEFKKIVEDFDIVTLKN